MRIFHVLLEVVVMPMLHGRGDMNVLHDDYIVRRYQRSVRF